MRNARASIAMVAVLTAATLLGAGCRSGSERARPATTTAEAAKDATSSSAPTTTRARTLRASAAPFALPSPRSGAAATTRDGVVLVMGGQDANKASTATVWQVDAAGRSVRDNGRLSTPLHDAGAATLANRVFVFGGGASSQYDTVQELAANGTATVVGRLPGARSDVSVAQANDQALIVGGYDGTNDLGDVLATNDGVSFARRAKLTVPVRYAAVGVVGNTLWVVGGLRGNNDQTSVQRVDLATGAVSESVPLPFTLAHASGVVIGTDFYVAGGRRNNSPSDAVWKLDPVTGTFNQAATLPYAVLDAAVASNGDVTYLLGGRRDAPIASVAELRME